MNPFAKFRLPIAGLESGRANSNWQSAIGNEKARAKQRGTSKSLEVFRDCLLGRPSCLAGYFTWPQVALTHHAFHRCLYASPVVTVKLLPIVDCQVADGAE
jgi:hypothetical protein